MGACSHVLEIDGASQKRLRLPPPPPAPVAPPPPPSPGPALEEGQQVRPPEAHGTREAKIIYVINIIIIIIYQLMRPYVRDSNVS